MQREQRNAAPAIQTEEPTGKEFIFSIRGEIPFLTKIFLAAKGFQKKFFF